MSRSPHRPVPAATAAASGPDGPDLPGFASSPGDRFWGANDLFSFDSARLPTRAFDPGLDPAGPFDPPPRPTASSQRPLDRRVPPFDPSRNPGAPGAEQEPDLSSLLSHLALPPSAAPPTARRASPQPHLPPSDAYMYLAQGHKPGPAPPGHRGFQPHAYPGGPMPNRSNKQDPNEEITTVFLAGFPDDITEREFNNYFVFARGFEAASLKFPSPPASEEPFHSLGPGGAQPGPRTRNEQIIGFAKFRTRSEAMSARDYLNGRLVDAERGCVLKTEMAKKNLHTKSVRMAAASAGALSPSLGSTMPGVAPPGHHSSLSLPQMAHPHHPASRHADRYFLPPDMRNPALGSLALGPLSGSLGGVNSLGEAGSLAGGALSATGSLSPRLLNSGPVSPIGIGSVPIAASLSASSGPPGTTLHPNSSSLSPGPIGQGGSPAPANFAESLRDKVKSPPLGQTVTERAAVGSRPVPANQAA